MNEEIKKIKSDIDIFITMNLSNPFFTSTNPEAGWLLDIMNRCSDLLEKYGTELNDEPNEEQLPKPKIACICCSSKYWQHINALAKDLVEEGYVVLTPIKLNSDTKITREFEEQLIQQHFRKIDLADEVYVIKTDKEYGEAVYRELEYAMKANKRIFSSTPIMIEGCMDTKSIINTTASNVNSSIDPLELFSLPISRYDGLFANARKEKSVLQNNDKLYLVIRETECGRIIVNFFFCEKTCIDVHSILYICEVRSGIKQMIAKLNFGVNIENDMETDNNIVFAIFEVVYRLKPYPFACNERRTGITHISRAINYNDPYIVLYKNIKGYISATIGFYNGGDKFIEYPFWHIINGVVCAYRIADDMVISKILQNRKILTAYYNEMMEVIEKNMNNIVKQQPNTNKTDDHPVDLNRMQIKLHICRNNKTNEYSVYPTTTLDEPLYPDYEEVIYQYNLQYGLDVAFCENIIGKSTGCSCVTASGGVVYLNRNEFSEDEAKHLHLIPVLESVKRAAPYIVMYKKDGKIKFDLGIHSDVTPPCIGFFDASIKFDHVMTMLSISSESVVRDLIAARNKMLSEMNND